MSKRNRACDSCRAKKAACRIDSAPPCYLCTLHRKECTFVHQTNRPRRFAELPLESGQIHGVLPSSTNGTDGRDAASLADDSISFNTLAPIQNEAIAPHFPGTSSMEYLLEGAGASVSGFFADEPMPTGFTPDGFVYPSPGVPAPQSEAEKSPESIPSNAANLHFDTMSVAPLLLGSSGDMDPSLLRHYQYDTTGKFHFKSLDIQSVDVGGKPTQFLLSPPSIFASSREEAGCDYLPPHTKRQDLETIVPEDIGHRLIALLNRIVVPNLPIFSCSNPLHAGSSPPHLLAAVYLLAEPFTDFDDRLCIDLAYEKPSGKALFKLINDVLSNEMFMPTISTVQTLILLVIRPSANPVVQDSSFKWTQLSTLIACAHSLGLHLDPKSWRISPCEIAQRRRLSCCIYMVDKWLALSLGRPPLLNPDTWSLRTLGGDDRLDSGLGFVAWSFFIKRVELASLLDRVLLQL